MEARVVARSVRLAHRIFTQKMTAPAPDIPQPMRVWAAQSLWLGLMSGWLEAGAVLGHQLAVGTVTNLSVRLNRYHVPLGMLAHLAIFAAAMALAALLAGRWSRRWWRDPLVSSLGWFVALVSPLLALEELHWFSSLILAAALAASIGPRWVRHREVILRRTLLPLAFASVGLAGFGFTHVQRAERRALAMLPPARPDAANVVLLVLDTVRADHLSLYGYHRPTTPRLDARAGQSTRFEFARSAAPWTLPSHATMFTGRWPHELSVDYDRPLDTRYPTLAEHLGRHGYLTGGFVGNTVYCNAWFGVDRGFARYQDAYENEEISPREVFRSAAFTRELLPVAVGSGLLASDGRYSPRKTAEEVNRDALGWLDAREGLDRDRPFFLFLNYIDAHGPYTVPDNFPRRFSTASPLDLIQANRRANTKNLPDAERYEGINRLGIDAYDDAIRYIDAQIDRLLAELDRRGKTRNTWVIVTADHGEHFGEHGLFIHGNSLYRPLVNVPLVVIPPAGQTTGHPRVATPVSLRDLPATVADLVGLGADAPFPGQSLRHHWDTSLSPPDRSDPPVSEWKIPAGTAGLGNLPARDRTRTALVDRDRIHHRDPLGAESLYDLADQHEAADLSGHPAEQPTLDHLRAVGATHRGDPR